MDIALLDKKVTIQANELITDEIGNHSNAWSDYYTCMATISGEGGDEVRDAGEIVNKVDLSVTVRWCSKTKAVTSTGYLIVIDDVLYDIVGIDHFSYTNKAIKFKCQKVRR
ncbi:MAG: phage head closure protein [Mogibacterium sp.]|nr:phage head closure protein [Mogibacterium sp.]